MKNLSKMKLTAFSVGLALSCLCASAQSYTVTSPSAAKYTWATIASGSNMRSMALSSNNAYFVNAYNKRLVKGDKTTLKTAVVFTEESVNYDYKLCSDDAGNVVIGYGGTSATSGTNKLRILPASPTAWDDSGAADIDLTGYMWNRADIVTASGDLLGGEGTLFIWPEGSTCFYRLIVNKGAVTTVQEVQANATATNVAYARPERRTDYATRSVTQYNQRVLTQAANPSYIYEWEIAPDGSVVNGPVTISAAAVPLGAQRLTVGDVDYDHKSFYIWCASQFNDDGDKLKNCRIVVMNANRTKVTYTEETYDTDYEMVADRGLWFDCQFNPGRTGIQVWGIVPGHKAFLYNFTMAVDKPANFTGSVEVNTDQSCLNRQDAYLSWDNPDGAPVRLYRKRSTDSSWSVVYAGTGCDYIDTNITGSAKITSSTTITTSSYKICYLTGEGTDYTSTTDFKECDFSSTVKLTPKFLPSAPQFIDDGKRNYDGFAKTQMIWTNTYGFKPDTYNIYRDGYLIAENVEVTNYIDRLVPEGTHTYVIESCYDKKPNEHAQSEEWVVKVAKRDKANELYGIEECYNYLIGDADEKDNKNYILTNSRIPMFYDQNLYRQAVYYQGYWFVAMRENDLTYTNGSQNYGATSEYGAIVRIRADKFDENGKSLITSAQDLRGSAKIMYKFQKCANVGIAVDDAGNFFIRKGTSTSIYEFSTTLTQGTLIKFKDPLEDPDSEKPLELATVSKEVTLDLSALKLSSLPIDEDWKKVGRCDYFSMTGKVFSAAGGYLYLAPTYSMNVYKVFIQNGAYVSHEVYTHKKADYYSEFNPYGSAENYAFKIDGRDDIIHSLRSQGIMEVDYTNKSSEWVYRTFSRINNAGGISKWFNNDLLLITPQAAKSKNIGDFTIARGTPHDPTVPKANSAAEVGITYSDMTPIISVAQESTSANVEYTNGIWFGVEPEIDADGNETALYIYVYVPAIRMAKYRLYPYNDLPVPDVNMSVDIHYDYDNDGNAIDILGFKGTASWEKINFGDETTDYTINEYVLRFLDGEQKQIGGEYRFDSNGNPSNTNAANLANAAAAIKKVGMKDESTDKSNTIEAVIYNLDAQPYTAELTLECINNTTQVVSSSEPVVALAETDYDPYDPEGTVNVVKENNIWQREDGTWHRNFRLDIDFDKPDNCIDDVDTEPVTYYELYYQRTASEDWQRITWMYIANGDGTWTCVDPDNIEGTEAIVEGTFDFENGKNQEGDNKVVVRVWWQPEVTAEGELVDSKDDPYNFTYMVRARYAARAVNKSIQKDGDGIMVTTPGGTTGVKDVDCQDCQEEGPATYYDLQGRRVLDPTCRHIYIKVQNGHATKEIPTNN